MKAFKNLCFIAAGVIVLSAVISATGLGHAVAAGVTNVFVTNSAAHPVPVSHPTQSIFATPAGGLSVTGCHTLVNVLNVSAYAKIRVEVGVRAGSDKGNTFYLEPVTSSGVNGPGLLDSFNIAPPPGVGIITQTYDVPGMYLSLSMCSFSTSKVDVWVFGN